MNPSLAPSNGQRAGIDARLDRLREDIASGEISAVHCLDGEFQSVPVPAELDGLTDGHLGELRVEARGLEMVDVGHHVELVRAFEIAKRTGMSGCRIRRSESALERPGEEASLRLYDLSDIHGVLLVLVGDFDEAWVDLLAVQAVDLRPKMLVHQSGPTGHYEIVDQRTPEVLGWKPEEMVGHSGLHFIHPDDHQIATSGWLRVLAGEDGSRQRCRFKTKTGEWLWMEVTYTNHIGADGHGHIRVEQLDIEEEMDALAQARATASQFETLAESLPVGVVHLDPNGHVVYANDWVRSLTGSRSSGTLASTALVDAVHPLDRGDLAEAIERCLDGREVDLDLRVLTDTQGRFRRCRVRARPLIVDHRWTGVIASVEDVTESVTLEERLRIQAATDPLTGLPNRAALTERLQEAVQGCRRASDRFACLFIDLDDFKLVNDGMGHQAGDDVLVAIARRLEAAVRPTDVLARVGGDEFIILCPWASRAEDVIGLAERVMRSVRQPLALGSVTTTVSASVGIALYEGSEAKADVLLSNADMAMYEAKRAGGGQWAIFGDRLRESVENRLDLHRSIEDAIRNDEFRLHLQPVVEVASGRVRGAEALLRWQHPTKGLTMPGDFIEHVAGSDLMRRLGWWIIADACRIAQVAAQASPDFEIGINVTGHQLAEPGFAETFLGIVHDHGLRAGNVAIEITETTLIEDGPLVGATLAALSRAGCAVALDDFGTGYSSLNHVRDMPVRTLKLDLSYTRRLLTCPATKSIVESIRDLAEKLDLTVVAEGVETEEQRQVLIDMGIRYAQGYLIARPCDEATFLREHLLT